MYLFVCDFFEIYPCGHIYQWSLLLSSHSVMSDSATPRTAACWASLSFTISQRSLKLMSTEYHGNFFISIIVHMLPWWLRG